MKPAVAIATVALITSVRIIGVPLKCEFKPPEQCLQERIESRGLQACNLLLEKTEGLDGANGALHCIPAHAIECRAAGVSSLSVDLRKLAAIDIAFLGRKFIIAEFAAGVVLSTALGLFVLVRGHSFWQSLLGVYFLCLGINYAPMFAYAMAIPTRHQARKEMAEELADRGRAMAKYRRLSVLLLIPLVVPVLAFVARQKTKPQ